MCLFVSGFILANTQWASQHQQQQHIINQTNELIARTPHFLTFTSLLHTYKYIYRDKKWIIWLIDTCRIIRPKMRKRSAVTFYRCWRHSVTIGRFQTNQMCVCLCLLSKRKINFGAYRSWWSIGQRRAASYQDTDRRAKSSQRQVGSRSWLAMNLNPFTSISICIAVIIQSNHMYRDVCLCLRVCAWTVEKWTKLNLIEFNWINNIYRQF